jgi:hypothetical protein
MTGWIAFVTVWRNIAMIFFPLAEHDCSLEVPGIEKAVCAFYRKDHENPHKSRYFYHSLPGCAAIAG